MSKEKQAEFLLQLKKELPDARVIEFQEKSLETFWGVIISGLQTVSLGVLWRIFDAWVKRYASAAIKISYRTHDDKEVEVSYTKLTKSEAEQILTEHPPRIDRPIRIILPRSK